MKFRISFNISAQRDLAGIADYTEQEWGYSQAKAYIDQIIAMIDKLADYPHVGSPVAHIRAGYRKLGVGSHSIWYRINEQEVEIVRILHQRMDMTDRL